MERELLGGNKGIHISEVRQALENAMLRNPSYWRAYYHGDEAQQRFSRAYSYSDRCRYYWHEAAVQEEIGRLLANLDNQALPATLISQFLPSGYNGSRSARPLELILKHIQAVLRRYAKACGCSQ
jgi:D-tagatose-1,6-bisphosphate aldolase subunit GatZ/KbaZ